MNGDNGNDETRIKELSDKLRILRRMRDHKLLSESEYNRCLQMLHRRHCGEFISAPAPSLTYDLISRVLSFLSILSIALAIIVSCYSLIDRISSGRKRQSHDRPVDKLIQSNDRFLYTAKGLKDRENPDYIKLELSKEEQFQTNRLSDIDIQLSQLYLDNTTIGAVFNSHFQKCIFNIILCRVNEGVAPEELSREIAAYSAQYGQIVSVLRFRVFLRDERFFDAMLIPGSHHIVSATYATKVDIGLRDLACFRASPTNMASAVDCIEYLSDSEAKLLYHEICAIADETRFNLFSSIAACLPNGFWNKYHPVKSSLVLAIFGIIYIIWVRWNRHKDEELMAKVDAKRKSKKR